MNFLIVDDHPLFRDALKGVLAGLGKGVRCIEASNCDEAREVLENEREWDLVLLDLMLPCGGGNGILLLEHIIASHPVPVVMMSASEDREDMHAALNQGALGYMPKSLPTAVMKTAVQLILAGGIYVPPQLMAPGFSPEPTPKPGASALSRLTKRQQEVAALLQEGYPNKEIAKRLGLSPDTVKAHMAAIFRTLGVNNRTAAVKALNGP